MPSAFQGLAKDITLQQLVDLLGTPPIYEQDTISVGAASAGSLTVSFVWDGNTYTSGSIPFNATAGVVAAAIQSAIGPAGLSLPAGSVVGSGGPLATALVTLQFQGQMVGPITAQATTPVGLTGGTAAFARVIAGSAGGIAGALAPGGGGVNPGTGMTIVIRGSDGKMYDLNGFGTGDSGVALQVGLPETAGFGSGATASVLHVGFKDVATSNMGSPLRNGALILEPSGAPGSAAPTKAELVAGQDPGGIMRVFNVDSNGNLSLQSSGQPGQTAPTRALQLAGVDTSGLLRALSASTAGALATMDAGSVPTAPLSINGAVPTPGSQPSAPIAVGTGSTLVLPDSTGGSSVSGNARGQLVVHAPRDNNVDITVVYWDTAGWDRGLTLGPGATLTDTYAGIVTAIHNSTISGQTQGATIKANLATYEWA